VHDAQVIIKQLTQQIDKQHEQSKEMTLTGADIAYKTAQMVLKQTTKLSSVAPPPALDAAPAPVATITSNTPRLGMKQCMDLLRENIACMHGSESDSLTLFANAKSLQSLIALATGPLCLNIDHDKDHEVHRYPQPIEKAAYILTECFGII
jgi:hypothetical protein